MPLTQYELFGENETHTVPQRPSVLKEPRHLNFSLERTDVLHKVVAIEGLYYVPAFMDPAEEDKAIDRVDSSAGEWRADLERRVQHYGWRYDYRAKTVTANMRIGPLPGWIQAIAERLHAETGLFDRVPDQAIVNEYKPGQGIAMHTDRHCFGPSVATVSLGDAWEMCLRRSRDRQAPMRHIMLERGSALILCGSARADWMHGIAKRRTEGGGDVKRARRRRLSLTFRTVVGIHDACPDDQRPSVPGDRQARDGIRRAPE